MVDCEVVVDRETGYGLVVAVLIGPVQIQILAPALPIGSHQQRCHQPRPMHSVIALPRAHHL
jgi:hypothetical protein